MYIRFVVHQNDENSGKRQGLFQALVEIRERGELFEYELERVKEIHKWFNKNLERPSSFNRSSKPRALNKAISWFKDGAKEHISQMRKIAAILENHGVVVDVIQTDRPGYIVYEDEHQVTVEPFSDSRT